MDLWAALFHGDRNRREEEERLRPMTGITPNPMDLLAKRVRRLERRLERQELLIEATFRTLRDQGHVTAEQFKDLVVAIDLEDGVEDGRIGPDRSAKAPKCPSCGKPINRKRSHCVYCHHELPKKRSTTRATPYRR
jgi:hypothetical protein